MFLKKSNNEKLLCLQNDTINEQYINDPELKCIYNENDGSETLKKMNQL